MLHLSHLRLDLFHWAVLAVFLLTASVLDVVGRRIPNWLTVALAVYGVALRQISGGYLASAWGVGGILAGLALLVVPFAKGWIGGGDVKLLAACGAWLAPAMTVETLLYTALAGGVVSLTYWARAPSQVRRDIWVNLKLSLFSLRMAEIERRPARLNPPYAPAIAAGVAVTVALHWPKLTGP